MSFGRCKTRERSKTLRIELNNMTNTARAVTVKHESVSVQLGGLAVKLISNELEDLLSFQYVLEKCTVEEQKVSSE